jgi:hypothetical protein
MARRYGYLGWSFVPEGHLIVARRFIAGSGTNGPIGSPSRRDDRMTEYRRAMYRPWAKPNFDRPSGTRSNPKNHTGDKSPAYFQVVPPGHRHRHDKVSVVSVFQNLASIHRGSARWRPTKAGPAAEGKPMCPVVLFRENCALCHI